MSLSHPLTTFLEQPEEFLQARERIYQPLDVSRSQIRLLHIAPAPPDDQEVNLTVEIVSLDDPQDYEAISYTWGALHPVSQVRIQNVPYNVCGSQHAALRHFRSPDKIRTMWMDVICIDEANVEERSQQVSMMKKIYTRSNGTQVWLGDIDPAWEEGITDGEWAEFVDTAMSKSDVPGIIRSADTVKWAELTPPFLEVIRHTNSLTRGALHVLELIAEDFHFTDMPYCLQVDNESIELLRPWYSSMRVLSHILDRPWWSRVWVLQEVALSSTDPMLHIGDIELPYSLMQRAADCYDRHTESSEACCYNHSIAIDEDAFRAATGFIRIQTLQLARSKAVAGEWTISDALVTARGLNCTDTRDHVYGVLGLVRKDDQMPVDYNLDTATLYSKASWYFYLTRQSLSWLDQGDVGNDSRTPGLPSWAVDWGHRAKLGFQFYQSFDHGAFPPDWSHVYCDWHAGTLNVTANPVDRVKIRLDRAYDPGWNPANNLAIVNSWIDQFQNIGVTVSREENREMPFSGRGPTFAFLSTIFRDTVVYYGDTGEVCLRRLNDEDRSDMVGWYMELNYICESLIEAYHPEKFSQSYAIAFRDQIRDSTMCLTEAGRMAMVPLSARTGDVIWHVRSCTAPLILRRMDNEERLTTARQVTSELGFPDHTEILQIVGPCYAADLMGVGDDWPDDYKRSICLV